MNKRGMSAVVTTLIIILLAIVAVGIVWVVVKNVISKGKEDISLTGLTLDLEILKASVDGDILSVTVKRSRGEGDLIGINFVFSDGDNSVVVRKDTALEELETETFTFNRNTDLSGIGDITSISVAPIFETSSGKEATGEIKDTATYTAGSVGSGGGTNGESPPGGNGEEPPDGCTPDCTGPDGIEGTEDDLECGLDPICRTLDCGDCDPGFSCGVDNMCYDDTCIDEDPSVTCSGFNCDNVTNNCGNPVNCTELLGTCAEQNPSDPLNWECIENYCVKKIYVNSGLVGWYGPPDVTKYFSSDSLPKTNDLYYGAAATFPGLVPQGCYIIIGYKYAESVYINAIVELNLEGPLSIKTDDPYEIWDSMSDCISSLSA